jgi:hypothetical protein
MHKENNMIRKIMALVMLMAMTSALAAAERSGTADTPARVPAQENAVAADKGEFTMDVLIKEMPFKKKKIVRGGFISPVLKYPVAGDYMNVFTGLRGAMVLNHRMAMGITGNFMPMKVSNRELTGKDIPRKKVHWKYGGPYMEYYFFPDKIAHLSLGMTLGAGWLSDELFALAGGRKSYFFAMEPELNLYLNVSKHHRLGLGASYLFTQGARMHEIRDKHIRHFAVSLFAQFGVF